MGSQHSRNLALCGDGAGDVGAAGGPKPGAGDHRTNPAGVQGAVGVHKGRNIGIPELQQWQSLVQDVSRRMGGADIVRSNASARSATCKVTSILNLRVLHAHPQVHSFSVRAGGRGELIVQVVFLPVGVTAERMKRVRSAQNRWANRTKTLAAALQVVKKEQFNGDALWRPEERALQCVRVLTRDHASVLLHHARAVKVQGVCENGAAPSMEVLVQLDE